MVLVNLTNSAGQNLPDTVIHVAISGTEGKRYADHVPDRRSGPSKIDNVLKQMRNNTVRRRLNSPGY
jgi:hypothetical protein